MDIKLAWENIIEFIEHQKFKDIKVERLNELISFIDSFEMKFKVDDAFVDSLFEFGDYLSRNNFAPRCTR